MNKLTPADLWKLEDYARERPAFRTRVLAHKQARTIRLGAHLTLLFEDRLTVQYQVQEMLRIERIFEADGIADELAAYNPLIPDGSNFKATLLIEYDDVDVRRRELERLRGIEHDIRLVLDGLPPIIAIADEDLERSNESKTSAVHFLRFELDPAAVSAFRDGTRAQFAIDHPHYRATSELDGAQRSALLADLLGAGG
jgi:PAS domain-containing protein